MHKVQQKLFCQWLKNIFFEVFYKKYGIKITNKRAVLILESMNGVLQWDLALIESKWLLSLVTHNDIKYKGGYIFTKMQ